MADLSVNINSSSKSYPIIINNEDISGLHKKILSYTSGKNFW